MLDETLARWEITLDDCGFQGSIHGLTYRAWFADRPDTLQGCRRRWSILSSHLRPRKSSVWCLVYGVTTSSAVSVLYAVLASRVLPCYRPIRTDQFARAAFEATSVFDDHLSRVFIKCIEVPRTCVHTKMLRAFLADILLERYMAFFVALYGIKGDLFFYRFSVGFISQPLPQSD